MNLMTFDKATQDSTGAFLINELERLDQTLHAPLAAVSWHRDVQLRTDVSMADEVSSFTVSTFASPGGMTGTGVNWISKDANALPNIALDIGIVRNPLPLWGTEIKWTIPELESAQKLGRPVDSQKLEGLKLKHNMDIDQIVYVGDSYGGATYGSTGLVNQPSSYVTNQGNATTGNWASQISTAAGVALILADINELLTSVWKTSAYATIPDTLLLPPVSYSLLNQTIVSTAGNRSILNYLMENNLYAAQTGRALAINPVKWLQYQVGPLATNTMVAYTNNTNFVRFPLVPLQRTTLQYDSIYQKVSYFARLGVVEVVYPETIGYRFGI